MFKFVKKIIFAAIFCEKRFICGAAKDFEKQEK
jgi:hypothetical protein